MVLSKSQVENIEAKLKKEILKKLANYKPESKYIPFQTRLLGTDRMALFSFIQSLNTTLGTSIYESVAVEMARDKFVSAKAQSVAGRQISIAATEVIQQIVSELETSKTQSNKEQQVERIRAVCQAGEMQQRKLTKVDLYLEDLSGRIYLFDIKTAKPNSGEFKGFKRNLLEWVAATLAGNPDADVHSGIAIPYNPYHPQPYQRWTIRGMYDIKHEILVAEEFWDFLAGEGAFQELLNVFEQVGKELRPQIDEAFSKFR